MRSSSLQQMYIIQNGKEGISRDSTNNVWYEDEAYPTRTMGRPASIGGIFRFAKFTCSFMTKTTDSNEGGYKLCLRKQDGLT